MQALGSLEIPWRVVGAGSAGAAPGLLRDGWLSFYTEELKLKHRLTLLRDGKTLVPDPYAEALKQDGNAEHPGYYRQEGPEWILAEPNDLVVDLPEVEVLEELGSLRLLEGRR